ncbi:MAG: hypothetical protein R3F18_09375 [Lysobacterales bacterium]|nr:hypothetical protein [Xanthomonadales bacterium]
MSRSVLIPEPTTRERSHLRKAGSELLEVMEMLQQQGRNVVTELQGKRPSMTQWQHYPDDDATDPVSGYRWYYHAHPEASSRGEHGHFHVFAAASTGRGYTHLLGLSMSASGLPLRAFTTNRWVTNEIYQPAARVLRLARRFVMRQPAQWALVHRWLAATMTLFRPQIAWLLHERDRRLAAAQIRRATVFEDRRTHVLSQCQLDLQAQFKWLDAAGPLKIRHGAIR